jgi:ribosomal protein S18 acetylase RimI-like enzyme
MTDPIVRRLVETDAADFKSIRLDGLRDAPEAFGSTYEAEKDGPIESFVATLSKSHVAGAFVDGALLGVAGFYVLSGPKLAHRGNIWGVYVRPAGRGKGLGKALISHLLAEAAPLVKQVHLTVVTDNAAAVRLYQQLGFETYGTEPRSLLAGERYFDEYLMVRMLDEVRP